MIISKITYLPTLGFVEYRGPGIAVILNDEHQSEGLTILRSDISKAPALVQDICSVVWDIPETRVTTRHKKFVFDSVFCRVKIDNRTFTPYQHIPATDDEDEVFTLTDYSNEAPEVIAFLDAVWTETNKHVYKFSKQMQLI